MVGSWSGRSNPEKHRDVIPSRLYEYHAQEGLWAKASTKVPTIRVPIDDEGTLLLRIELADTGEIEATFKERRKKTVER